MIFLKKNPNKTVTAAVTAIAAARLTARTPLLAAYGQTTGTDTARGGTR